MINPFRRPLVCLAPDGTASAVPAGDDTAMPNDQQTAQADAPQEPAPEATAQAAPAAEGQSAEPVAPDDAARDDAPDLAAQLNAMTQRAMQAELRGAAALMGVPEARIPYVLRMADTAGIDMGAADAPEQIAGAISRVLTDVPELRGAGTGTGSAGNFARRTDAQDALDGKIIRNILG